MTSATSATLAGTGSSSCSRTTSMMRSRPSDIPVAGTRPAEEGANQTVVAPRAADRADFRLRDGRLENGTGVVVEAASKRQIEGVAVGTTPKSGQDLEELLQLGDRRCRACNVRELAAQLGEQRERLALSGHQLEQRAEPARQ